RRARRGEINEHLAQFGVEFPAGRREERIELRDQPLAGGFVRTIQSRKGKRGGPRQIKAVGFIQPRPLDPVEWRGDPAPQLWMPPRIRGLAMEFVLVTDPREGDKRGDRRPRIFFVEGLLAPPRRVLPFERDTRRVAKRAIFVAEVRPRFLDCPGIGVAVKALE